MDGADRRAVVKYLSACEGQEFTEILREVFERRPDAKYKDAAGETQLVLSQAERVLEDESGNLETGPWELAAVAYFDPDRYGPAGLKGDPFLQFGRCDRCNIAVASHAKYSLCPLCRGKVYLT